MNSQSQPSYPIFAEGMSHASINLEFTTGGWTAADDHRALAADQKITTLSQLVDRMQDVLNLWMQWNNAYQELCAMMYSHRYDVQRLESLADDLDRLRQRAVRMTAELLARQQNADRIAAAKSEAERGEE